MTPNRRVSSACGAHRVLAFARENDPEVQTRIAVFRQGLEALGWMENRNVQIEHRFSRGDIARIQAYTAELVSSTPDLIIASSSPVTAALKQATHLASASVRRHT